MKREVSFEEKRWVKRAMVPMGLWAVASTILVFMAWVTWPEWVIISTALWLGSVLVASSVLAMWQAYLFPEGGERKKLPLGWVANFVWFLIDQFKRQDSSTPPGTRRF